MNKINTIKTISALVISALRSASCQMNFDERLQHEAEEFTKNNCPQEPEAGTRLDSVAYSPQSKTYTLYIIASRLLTRLCIASSLPYSIICFVSD